MNEKFSLPGIHQLGNKLRDTFLLPVINQYFCNYLLWKSCAEYFSSKPDIFWTICIQGGVKFERCTQIKKALSVESHRVIKMLREYLWFAHKIAHNGTQKHELWVARGIPLSSRSRISVPLNKEVQYDYFQWWHQLGILTFNRMQD